MREEGGELLVRAVQRVRELDGAHQRDAALRGEVLRQHGHQVLRVELYFDEHVQNLQRKGYMAIKLYHVAIEPHFLLLPDSPLSALY